jgi:RimJ/RimL family protein N-acetyltransferase
MEAVEINAGAYYLRQFRADDRIDDRPALVAAFADDRMRRFVTRWQVGDLAAADQYVSRRTEEWDTGERCSWAVAEPTSGELLGEVDLIRLDPAWTVAEAGCWVAAGARGRGIAPLALGAALRFGAATLPLRRVDYLHAPENEASARVAAKCGFVRKGLRDGLVWHRREFTERQH